MRARLYALLLVVIAGITASGARAEPYFGFDLGNQTVAQLVDQLARDGADYVVESVAYHPQYPGNPTQLIRAKRYSRLAKYSATHDASLYCDLDGRLFLLSLSISRTGIWREFKELLDAKYGVGEAGLSKTIWRSGPTRIELLRVWDDDSLILTYTNETLAAEMERRQRQLHEGRLEERARANPDL